MKFIFVFLLLISCKDSEKNNPLTIAKDKCNHIKGEYNSYFDTVEKCIDAKQDKASKTAIQTKIKAIQTE